MVIKLNRGWQVLQDHFDVGEQYRIYEDCYDPTVANASYPGGAAFQMDEWRDIPALDHLQVMLSQDPQLDPAMRLYNAAPWWYRVSFHLEMLKPGQRARLRFDGVDYYCKVYLNGAFLGSHEGYQTEFVLDAPVRAGENVLYLKVWSPLEFERVGAPEESRCLMTVRNMLKGTYEHGDSLLHRDRNPVGIWRDVYLEIFQNLCFTGPLRIDALPDGRVRVALPIRAEAPCEAAVSLRIRELWSGAEVARLQKELSLSGTREFVLDCLVEQPALWNTWDRGGARLYEAFIRVGDLKQCVRFGFRKVELLRTEKETTYYLNGARLYIRGASYYPDPYLSLMYKGRIRRDLELLKQGGCNMVRVHVHRELPEFYDLCDEMGIAVMQDTDFNWVHPLDEAWTDKALMLVEEEIRALYNHPSILTWVLMNEPVQHREPDMGRYAGNNAFMYEQPGPQLMALTRRLDPNRPLILGSYCEKDPDSGDSHNYLGSIDGPAPYTLRSDMAPEKLNTEFGFDAPPDMRALWQSPAGRKVIARWNKTGGELDPARYYQYRFLKYCIEGYRLKKYAPTSGHIQFMLVDCSPMSYYGVLDYYGCPKKGYDAFLESNQPLGLFIDEAGEIHLINDYSHGFSCVTLCWTVVDDEGMTLTRGEKTLDLAPDSVLHAGSIGLSPAAGIRCSARLSLAQGGEIIASNRYDDLFHHPGHPEGHPQRFSNTYGIRLF